MTGTLRGAFLMRERRNNMTGMSGLYHGTAGSYEGQIERLKTENEKLLQENEKLLQENQELHARCNCLETDLKNVHKDIDRAYLNGKIEGLMFSIRCNGVSGAEVSA